MTWSREASGGAKGAPGPPSDDFHRWILSLPWVVERPYSVSTPGVRTFAVDCEPLARRRLWLVSGLRDGCGVAVIVPAAAARELELIGLTAPIAPMPPGHVLVCVRDGVDEADLDRVVLEAYSHAFA
jgi:hypothetical protein